MNLRILPLLALSCSLAAQGAEIYSNGPIVSLPNGGFGGNPVSILQYQLPPLGLGNNNYGYGAQVAGTNSVADDFAVHGTWAINAIEVFGYASNAVGPSCTDVRIEIYNNRPDQGGVPVAGSPGFANNLFATAGYTVSNTMTATRRVLDTTPLDNTRIVQSVKITLPAPLTLNTGVYWLRFQYAGLNFTPPITTPFMNPTGFALQFAGTPAPGSWSQATDLPGATPKGIPFKLYGTSTSAPGAITNLGGGCDSATFTVGGQPSMGGYLRAELGNLNPQHIPVITVGFNNPNVGLGVCSCTIKASSDLVNVGSLFTFEAPMTTNFVGFQFFLQGAQLDLAPVGGAPCNLGLRFGLTNGYSWRAY